jgi:glutathione-regulated potassium-efflux system ancillary protein KefG
MPGGRVLVLFAHPSPRRSRVHQRLADAVRGLDGVTVHDLYAAYPDFDIDVPHEQALLAAHDVVVMQHPFYWYSTPAILKQWQDVVLEHGWAYGSEGTALRGKLLLSAISTGGLESAYCREGGNRYTVGELLSPLAQTAFLCGMEFLPPFVVHGTHAMDDDALEAAATDYALVVTGLRDGRLDLTQARTRRRLGPALFGG